MQYGLQELFVTHDDGRTLLVGGQVCLQPRCNRPGLCIFGRGGHDSNVFFPPQIVETCLGQCGREAGKIATQEGARFEMVVIPGICHVVIPIEEGFSALRKVVEKSGFHLVEHIESDESIQVGVRRKGNASFLERFGHTAVDGTLIGQSVGGKRGVELLVDRKQCLPQAEELLFHFGVLGQ